MSGMLVFVSLVAALWLPARPAAAAPARCAFVLGFAALHAALPMLTGTCRDDQAFDVQGNATQHTVRGLLFWRKSDNATFFTDGYHTWVSGIDGIRQRRNSERFAWEQNAGMPGTTVVPQWRVTAPPMAAVDAAMARTAEAAAPHFQFAAFSPLLTVPDDRAGSITAVVGVRSPTADAYGQVVFFWHNAVFLGWDSDRESVTIRLAPAGVAAVTAIYAHYGASDPLCCPKLSPVPVTYTWNGARLVAGGTPPSWGPRPLFVTFL